VIRVAMALADLTPLDALTDEHCAALRERFHAVGFNPKRLGDAEDILPQVLFNAGRVPVVLWRLAERADPAAHLLRLFNYGDGITEAEARVAFGDALYEVARASLIEVREGTARARFQITPFHDLWIVADDQWLDEDAVMGATATTQSLSRWLPERVEGTCLDVGCGAGSLALLLAKRGGRATGTDLNPRAVALARFNARFNGLAAEFLEGSLYEPVAGRRFDRIVAQPPYVSQAPGLADVKILYGGSWGDELALRFVAGAPAALAPGGQGVFMFESAARKGSPLHARLGPMLEGAPVDLVLLSHPGAPADLEAVLFASQDEPTLDAAYVEAVGKRWRHFRALGLEEFQSVLAVVRAHEGTAVTRGAVLASRVGSFRHGDAAILDAYLAGVDLLRAGDGAVSAAKVRLGASATWREERRPDDEEPKRTLLFPEGIASKRDISEPVYALLSLLHESASVAEATARYGELCGVEAGEVRPQVLGFVREMLGAGVLAPVG
jgi:SAM-dependent methyltransferase